MKNIKYVAFGAFVVLLAIFIFRGYQAGEVFYGSIDPNSTEGLEISANPDLTPDQREDIMNGQSFVEFLLSVDLRLYINYAVFAEAVLALLAFVIFSLTTNGAKNLGSLIGVGALVGLMIIFYVITPAETSTEIYEKTETGLGWNPIISSGLFTIYTLLVIFVGLLGFFGVRNLIK